MAAVAKLASPSIDSSNPLIPQIAGDQFAGEAIGACDLCYLNTDGKWYRANGTALGITVRFPHVCPTAAQPGQAITLFGPRIRYRYAAAGTLTPGSIYYISATTPGSLDTAATTGDTTGTVVAVTDTDVVLVRVV
jgi:hypothetical protein